MQGRAWVGERALAWPYSPGRNRRDAAAGPAGVQAAEGDRLRTAALAPEGSWGTALDRSGRGLKEPEAVSARCWANYDGARTGTFDFRTNRTVSLRLSVNQRGVKCSDARRAERAQSLAH